MAESIVSNLDMKKLQNAFTHDFVHARLREKSSSSLQK